MENSLGTVAPVQVRIHGLTVRVKSAAEAMQSSRRLLEKVFKFRRNTERISSLSNTILEDVSLDIPAGTLTAILGPSGSGKSALLNSVAGRLSGTTSGSITFNSNSETKDVRSAYLMQDDVLQSTLTVRETLQYAADLRLPPPMTKMKRHAIVEEVILELGLKDCADTRIESRLKSGCSGGEKRRTSLGVQMLSNPSVLFCDEPTTGQFQKSASSNLTHSKNWQVLMHIVLFR
jgi:ABC-type multidrug transport system ATPase subunit